ncbi:MAG: acyl-CoA dehydrogenase family protein [Bacteroidetes bacterium]|nr:acyl-CoA dehydrogenase family protein [Bacteroidota bacterium]
MENFYTDNPHLRFHLSHPLMARIVKLKESDYTQKDKYDFAPLDYEDAIDSYDKIMEIIGEISGEIIAPNAESVDKEGPKLVNNEVKYARGTRQNHDALVKAGLVGFTLPRDYDGLNMPHVPYVMSGEIISRADAGFANIWGLQDCAETILEFASDELKVEFLPRFNKGDTAAMDLTEPDAGSDLQAVQLKATYDTHKHCWLLDGVKRFITNGDADISLVLARSEEGTTDARGLSLFVYDRKDKAVTVRRIENKLGIKGSPTCELVFRHAPAKLIGDTKLGLIKYVMSLMNSARLGVGSQSVGIAEAAYREAYKYATEREQFGKAIIKYPAVYEMLTNMKIKIDGMRSLLYETARYVDLYKGFNFAARDRKPEAEERQEAKNYQKLADMFTPLLKLYTSEGCNQIAYDAIQIFGGTGYMKDFPIERIYRDARITTIYEGTSQLQVVAAIRYVGNGGYLAVMRERSGLLVKPELEYLRSSLEKMTEQFARTVEKINEYGDNEYSDFHSRRLVEMAANVLIGYLLLYDANRSDEYTMSADIFIRKARAENVATVSFINNCHPKEVNDYKR